MHCVTLGTNPTAEAPCAAQYADFAMNIQWMHGELLAAIHIWQETIHNPPV